MDGDDTMKDYQRLLLMLGIILVCAVGARAADVTDFTHQYRLENNYVDTNGTANMSGNGSGNTFSGIAKEGIYSVKMTGSGSASNNSADQRLGTGNVNRSISLWFNTTSIGIGENLGGVGPDGTNNAQMYLFIVSGTLFDVQFYNDNPRFTVPTLNPNQWYHVVAVYNTNRSVYLYINGTLIQSLASNNPANFLNTGALRIGENSLAGGRFTGHIDDMRFYNRSLSSAEVLNIYNGVNGSASGSDMQISINDTRTGLPISGFSWNYTTNNASDGNTKSGYCAGTSCTITNITGTLNISAWNVSGGTYFNPLDSPKLSFVFNVTPSSYAFQTYQNSLTMNITNSVNGSVINAFCANVTNSTLTMSSCTNVGSLTFYNVSGQTNLTWYSVGNSSYFDVKMVLGVFNATNTLFTNNTYQALLNVTAYQLFTLQSISVFNATNGLSTNTTAGAKVIKANNGTNNFRVDVPGNYSLNATCNVSALFSTVQCNVTGVYDTLYNITGLDGASLLPISTFTVTAMNGSYTANVTAVNNVSNVPLLQGYAYFFSIDAMGYGLGNVTLPANASSHAYQFTLNATNSIFIRFFDETTVAAISQGVTVTFNNGTYTFQQTNGTSLLVQNLAVGTWSLTTNTSNYLPRTYYVTVTSRSTQTLDMYLLSNSTGQGTLFTVKDATQGNVVPAAVFTVQNQENSPNWVTVAQVTTDAFGQALFSLQPNHGYQFTITATSYAPKSGAFTTAITTYTVLLTPNNTQQYLTYLDDFSYKTTPSDVTTNVTNFTITVSSPGGNLQWFAVVVSLNGTNYTQNVTGSPSGGTASVQLNLSAFNKQTVTASYWVQSVHFSQPFLYSRSWYIYGVTAGNYTFNDFMVHYGDDNNGLPTTARGLIVTVIAVCAAVVLGLAFGVPGGVIGAATVYLLAGIYGWMGWGIVIVVVALLVGTLAIGGRY